MEKKLFNGRRGGGKKQTFLSNTDTQIVRTKQEHIKKKIQQYDKYNLKVSKEDSMIALHSIYFFTVLLVAFG